MSSSVKTEMVQWTQQRREKTNIVNSPKTRGKGRSAGTWHSRDSAVSMGSWEREGGKGKRFRASPHFIIIIIRYIEVKGRSVYLSAVMVRISVALQYLSPTSLSIFLRACSSRFKLDSFTCDGKNTSRLPQEK